MKYICTGRVHPERADVSFSRVEMKFEGGGTAVASCDASQVTVVLDVSNVDGWIAAQLMADDVANILVGSLGFSLGSGYSVELIQVTEEDGTPHVFGVRPEGEKPGQTLGIDPQIPAFNRAFRLSGRDVFFRLALRDYLRAITDVTDCATYCYRAIEGIKSAFVFKTGFDRWDDMHAALGTERDAITTTVKQYADAVRHGNWVNAKPTNKLERWKMLSLTRDILIKYLDYAEP
ncbi:MAG TPA: hypothetical protein PLZ79_10640, partial [Burkholderiales bacterium]|nr:hypothetical protein [Burkholderiales bacterium]